MMIRKNTWFLAAILGLAVALGLLSGAVPAQTEDTRNIRFPTPFKHVVVIFRHPAGTVPEP
jgi:hypothetical protein